MNKYIDSEKLIAEIERWRDKAKEKYNESTYSMGRCDALAEFRNHIVSLLEEHPEVEIEKELDRYLRGEFQQTAGGNFNNYIQIARHFAEWGAIHLNARKEE